MKRINTSVDATDSQSVKKRKKSKANQQKIRSGFDDRLRKMYWCENELVALLPKLAKMSTSYELTAAILAHLAVTENQIIRLIHIFDIIGEHADMNKCDLMDHIVTKENIDAIESGYYRDTAIVSCTQQIMEYEIRQYTQLHQSAIKLKEELASEFLATAVKEENNAHRTLAEISLSAIYFDAAS